MQRKDISIIIVNYNTGRFLINCLQSIYNHQPMSSFEVIIIDNNSTDNSIASVIADFPQVNLIRNKQNFGFAKANNQGLEIAQGNYYVLLNPDTLVLPGSIDLMIEFMEKDKKIGILGPKLMDQDYKFQDSCKKFPSRIGEFLQNTFLDKILPVFLRYKLSDDYLTRDWPLEVNLVTGACLVIKKSVIDDIGSFDTNFFLYYEEVDLCYRAQKSGWKIFFFPEAKVIHYGGKSTEKNLTASLTEAFNSKIYFLKKHYKAEDIASIRKFSLLGAKIRYLIWSIASVTGFNKNEAINRINSYKHILKIKKDPYIAMDISSIFRSRAGVGHYTKNLTRELLSYNTNSRELIFIIKERIKINLKRKRNNIIRFCNAIMHLFWEQLAIPVFLRKNGINLFHSPAFVCPLIKICPTIITIHDMAYLLYPGKFVNAYRRYLKFWVPLCVKVADKVITDSFCSKRDIIRLLKIPEEKIEVVYLGKDSSFKQITDKALIDEFCIKHGIKKKFILHVGTLEPRKNITGLIKAYSIFKKENNECDFNLVIAGEKGWMYSSIFALVEKLKLENSVTFIGYIEDGELPILYNAAKVFVYPSLYEGFGLPVLEAMACGIPVITSNTSSLPEIVGDAGIMVDPRDSAALAAAIQKVILDNDLREEMIRKGLKKAENFSWEKTAKETTQIYNKVLNSHEEKSKYRP